MSLENIQAKITELLSVYDNINPSAKDLVSEMHLEINGIKQPYENGDGILYRAANDINVTLDKANIVVKYATKYCITYGLNHKLCDGVDYLCNEIRSFKQRLL